MNQIEIQAREFQRSPQHQIEVLLLPLRLHDALARVPRYALQKMGDLMHKDMRHQMRHQCVPAGGYAVIEDPDVRSFVRQGVGQGTGVEFLRRALPNGGSECHAAGSP